MVMNINPKPTWKKPAKNPKKISWYEIIILFESAKPIKQQQIPAINCAGTISTDGYFLTIIIKTANVMGIENAAKFPFISPGDKELPTMTRTPMIAKIIENRVIEEIFSLRKKYPNIARNKICNEIIKFVLATVVLYMATTYPQNPSESIVPAIKPGKPDKEKALNIFFL